MTPKVNLNHQFRKYPRVPKKRRVLVSHKGLYERTLKNRQLERYNIYQQAKLLIPLIIQPANMIRVGKLREIKNDIGKLIENLDNLDDDGLKDKKQPTEQNTKSYSSGIMSWII